MDTTSTAAAGGGVSLPGLAILAVLAYAVAAAAGFVRGPRDLWRAIRHPTSDTRHPTTPRSDGQTPGGAGVVSDVGLAKVIPLHVVQGMVRQSAEAARGDAGSDDRPPPPVSRRERRDWVADRLRPGDALGLTATQIDAQGARLFDCSEKTIERDRLQLSGRRARGTRP
jgi:hypothetical protein